MGWKPFKKLGKALKKGAKKLGGQLKKHGPTLLKGAAALGLASFVPGVGGLLGKAIGGLSGKAGLGNILSQGLGNIGKGGLKGLLGHATNWAKGGGLKKALLSEGEKYARRQLGQEAQRHMGGPMPGPMPQGGFNMMNFPPSLLGMSDVMQQVSPQGGPAQGPIQGQPQVQIPYQEQGIQSHVGGNAWTGV